MRVRLRPVYVELGFFGLVLAVLVIPFRASGVWDPFELEPAEAARWIAATVFGAKQLAIGSDPTIPPTLTDLGMGELPFTSMGLAYDLLGYRDWVGRAAMLPWAILGLATAYAFVRRYFGVKQAMITAACLVTMPLFYLHARSMAGEPIPQAALVFAVVGLGVSWLEPSLHLRITGVALAILGLVAGYLSRGMFIGVAVPLCAAGGAALAHGGGARRVQTAIFGCVFAIGATLTAIFFVLAIPKVDVVEPLRRSFGMMLYDPNPRASTFDRILRHIGHGAFPWSALLPFAIGRLATGERESGFDPRVAARTLVLATIATSFLAHTALVPYAGPLPFAGAPFLGMAVGIFLVDAEDGRHGGRIAAIGVAAVTLLLHVDLKRDPTRLLAAFPFESITLPEAAMGSSAAVLALASVLFAGVAMLAFFDPPRQRVAADEDDLGVRERLARWVVFRVESTRRAFAAFVGESNGNFAFAAVLVEAALIGLAAMLYVGGKIGVARIEKLPRLYASVGLMLWWVVPCSGAAALVVWTCLRDGIRGLERWTHTSRITVLAAGGLVAGGLLSLGVHPSVLRQLSPREAILTYARHQGGGASLGVVGVSPRVASFYTADRVSSFDEPREAFRFLNVEGEDRFLVFNRRDLPKLNSLFRTTRGQNLPVLDTQSSLFFLGANRLTGDNQNPLDIVVSSAAPSPSFPTTIVFAEQIEAIGYDIVDPRGKKATFVVPGRTYAMRFYYKVLRPVSGTWQAFLHVDGQGRRHNGDHPVARGAYPMNHWIKGDVITDEYDLDLDPNFLPGNYAVYFGFFNTAGRMNVTQGQHDEDRAFGGLMEVR